jgi:hypothetical protein
MKTIDRLFPDACKNNCPKCNDFNAASKYMPEGQVYANDEELRFNTGIPAKTITVEEHLLWTCRCGYFWITKTADSAP